MFLFRIFKPCEHEVDVFVVVFTVVVVVVVVGARVGQRQCWCSVTGINVQRPEMIIMIIMVRMRMMTMMMITFQ